MNLYHVIGSPGVMEESSRKQKSWHGSIWVARPAYIIGYGYFAHMLQFNTARAHSEL